jgi:hypothetical protein
MFTLVLNYYKHQGKKDCKNFAPAWRYRITFLELHNINISVKQRDNFVMKNNHNFGTAEKADVIYRLLNKENKRPLSVSVCS